MSFAMTAYAPMTDTSGRQKDHYYATTWASGATGKDLRAVFVESLLYDLPQTIVTDELFPFQEAPAAPIDYGELKAFQKGPSMFNPMHDDRVYEDLYVVFTRVRITSSHLQLHVLCHHPRSYTFERASPGPHPHCG
jgi:hypothetical protein